jgi:hypothetical protein
MKDLAELLSEIPLQSQATSAPLASVATPSPITLADADEEMLARIFMQMQRPASPTDFNLIFKFSCLGLGAMFLALAGLIAYWNRPAEALASAQTMREMGSALVVAQQQNQAMAIAANPPQYKCFALKCDFPEQEQQRQLVSAPMPVANPHPDVQRAREAIQQWEGQGYDDIAISQFVSYVAQNPGPEYPNPQALTLAYSQLYGAN